MVISLLARDAGRGKELPKLPAFLCLDCGFFCRKNTRCCLSLASVKPAISHANREFKELRRFPQQKLALQTKALR